MIINIENNAGELKLSPVGRLDTTTAPEFDKAIKENIEGASSLIMDFAELEYISSAGLRIILATQKLMNKQGSMIVKNVNETVMEVFEITGFSDILNIQ